MEFDLSAAAGWFFHPPPYPDFSYGLIARLAGKEQMIKEALLDFYAVGFKDGFIACAALSLFILLICLAFRSVKHVTPNG